MRIHLFEFEDQSWLPSLFRRSITDLLSFQINIFGVYEGAADKLREILEETGHTHLIDLCSGSGGPTPALRKKISSTLGREIELCLTDKYPNAQEVGPFVAYHPDSIDATAVPAYLKGVRTLFTSFHHFKPQQAEDILQNAVDARMPIAIFELTERKLASLATLLIAPLTSLIFSLALRPVQWRRLFWTYLIPVIPLLYTWDGLVSNLRTYTTSEWLQMTRQLKNNHFRWEVGTVPSKILNVHYLLGVPE